LAQKTTGEIIAWGDKDSGADLLYKSYKNIDFGSNIISVYSTQYSFSGIDSNGAVTSWGNPNKGGSQLVPIDVRGNLTSNIINIYSSRQAFAALKNDGSVITWGDQYSGAISEDNLDKLGNLAANVINIYSTNQAFSALKDDGSVVSWGAQNHGGYQTIIFDSTIDDPDIVANLSSNVLNIYASNQAFVATKIDGSIVYWGYATPEQPSNEIQSNLSNIGTIYSTGLAYTATKSTPQTVENYFTNTIDNDKYKINILKDPANRKKVLNTNMTITGNKYININMTDGKTYYLINYQEPITSHPISGDYFYIPSLEGERIVILGNTYTSHGERAYKLENNLLEQTTNPIVIDEISYYLLNGSITTIFTSEEGGDENEANVILGNILTELKIDNITINSVDNGIISGIEILLFNEKFSNLNKQFLNSPYINLIRDIHRNEIRKLSQQ
jgi:hypothetical protein